MSSLAEKTDIQTNHTFAVLAYRESPYIEECIQSLVKQKVQSRIALCTSTPSVFLNRLAEKYGLQILHNPRCGGIAADWSFAYNASNTQYVTLAHQDDVYYPDYAERCLRLASKRPDNLITFTGYNELYKGMLRSHTLNLRIKTLMLACFYLNRNTLEHRALKRALLAFGSPIPCPSVMYNKNAIGYFEFSNEFSVNMDWEAWMRLAEREGAFLYVREKLMAHRIHKESQTTASLGHNVRQVEDKTMFERLWPKPIADVIARFYTLSYKSND